VATTVVNTHEAKSRLSELIRLVEAGQEVILARNGTLVAKIIPWPQAPSQRTPGAWRDRLIINDEHLVGSDPDVTVIFDDSAEAR
jgi:prevent-host-death family protein